MLARNSLPASQIMITALTRAINAAARNWAVGTCMNILRTARVLTEVSGNRLKAMASGPLGLSPKTKNR